MHDETEWSPDGETIDDDLRRLTRWGMLRCWLAGLVGFRTSRCRCRSSAFWRVGSRRFTWASAAWGVRRSAWVGRWWSCSAGGGRDDGSARLHVSNGWRTVPLGGDTRGSRLGLGDCLVQSGGADPVLAAINVGTYRFESARWA